MKRILSFALLLLCAAALNAQNEVGFLYNGNVYQNGDTMVVICEKTANHINSISFRNQTSGALRDMVITLTETERDGFEVWGICTGDLCTELTSAPFSMPPNSEYNEVTFDITIDQSVERPYGVYDMVLSNGNTTCGIVVRFQAYAEGIDNILANSSVTAFPNPAQGTVNINYSVERPATLTIYDVTGRQVRQQPISGNGTLSINDLAAGVYAYGIASGNLRGKMQKLIVQ